MAEFEIFEGIEPVAAAGFSATPLAYGTKFELAVPRASPARLSPLNCAVRISEWRAIWLAPGRWMLLHPMASQPPPALTPDGRLTDISHGMVEFACDGLRLKKVFAKATPLDLRHFEAGQCARTWFAGFPVLIDCRETDWRLLVEAPLAAALRAWLADAA